MTSMPEGKPITYRESGVDAQAGEEALRRALPLAQRTFGPRVVSGDDGRVGLFRLDFNEKLFQRNYAEPVLASCAAGVGTKVKVALLMNRLDTLGIDCVAMSVNDLICRGAEPLFFLDRIATGKLSPQRVADLRKGVSDGCLEARCALLGGEVAEMPDLHVGDDFDLSGFAVGVVERSRLIDGSGVEPGDVAIALASNGLHSNGYGLARRVLLDRCSYSPDDAPPELQGASVGQEMLRPTRIYVRPVLEALGAYRVKKVVKALAHIAGGGLSGSLPRLLGDGLTLRVKRDWPVAPIFTLIAQKGPVDDAEMLATFNMGVGFVMIVASGFAQAVMNRLRRTGERCWPLGKVVKGGPELRFA